MNESDDKAEPTLLAKIVIERFGMDGRARRTVEQIAEKHGLSKDTVKILLAPVEEPAHLHEWGSEIGACMERVSNGVDFDACEDQAVMKSDAGSPLCRTHAEARLGRAEKTLAEIRKVIES